MKLTKLVVASHNDGKVAEIKALLAPLHIEVQSAKELRLGDVEETGKTFEENAKIKANAACPAWQTIPASASTRSTAVRAVTPPAMPPTAISNKGWKCC